MTLGLIVGKFYPPHRGHKLLIESARRQCDQLIVILAHHPSQQIPGEMRLRWLREIHPDCDIRLVPDELENDSRQWATWTLNYLGRAPDVVFSSEDYGPIYAGLMGARHVMVDRQRAQVPVSGTAVRNDWQACADLVEPCVWAYLVPRVVLVGAESTGKTTLAQQLAEHFQTVWVPEFGRAYWERKALGWQQQTPTWTSEEFVHIATEQQRQENQMARVAGKVLICDTNAMATGVWHERYMGFRSPAVDAIGERDVADLYLLLDVDVPFVQDGWRDGEAIRRGMHKRFEGRLAELNKPSIIVRGEYSSRLAKATRCIDDLLTGFRRIPVLGETT